MVVVDACCGKGVFSLLCSYVFAASEIESDDNDHDHGDNCLQTKISIRKIIMLDKDPKLRWDHVDATNDDTDENDHHQRDDIGQRPRPKKRPIIECWPNFNLHEIDEVVDLLSQQIIDIQKAKNSNNNNNNQNQNVALGNSTIATKTTDVALAVVGIHLCKTLSPTCIGIVNALGPEKCPCLVLAPCCLPRVVVQSSRYKYNKNKDVNVRTNTNTNNSKINNTTINPNNKSGLLEIRQHETLEEIELRKKAKQRRNEAMVRGKGGNFFKNHNDNHNRSTQHGTTMGDQVRLLSLSDSSTAGAAGGGGACWKCGEFGHQKKACPSTQSTGKPRLVPPASLALNVSDILDQERPFRAYCDLLASSVQRDSVSVRETSIDNDHYYQKSNSNNNNKNKNQANNWNQERKSIFIVTAASAAAIAGKRI